MTEYQGNHVKRNPENGDIAIRTIFPKGDTPQVAMMEWLVSSATTGPRNTWTTEVEQWDDLFTPTPEQVAGPPF